MSFERSTQATASTMPQLGCTVVTSDGHQLGTMRKYKNIVAGHHKVSLIIDDLKSFRPWQPRGIRIHGIAEVVQRQGHLGPGSYLAITPLVSWSWGIEEPGSELVRAGPKKIKWP